MPAALARARSHRPRDEGNESKRRYRQGSIVLPPSSLGLQFLGADELVAGAGVLDEFGHPALAIELADRGDDSLLFRLRASQAHGFVEVGIWNINGGFHIPHSSIMDSDKFEREPMYTKETFIVEQDHRAIKRRCACMLGFKSFTNASIVLAGIELANRIGKRQFSLGRGQRSWALPLNVLWGRALAQ